MAPATNSSEKDAVTTVPSLEIDYAGIDKGPRVIKAIVDLGDRQAIFHLRTLIGGDDADVRASAAAALGEVGDKDDLFYLRQELKDVDGRARIAAAKSIIQIRRKIETGQN